jgi:thiamine-phosphate pyrophosphorylase
MRGLYAIVDIDALGARHLDPIAFACAVLSVRPAALQVRAKDLSTREFLALLRRMAPLCRGAGVPLVVNDRVDLAVLAGCDVVHVGQEDLPAALVQRIAPGLRVGVSTHTLEQLDRALALRPSYVAFGPVYPTTSKVNPDAVVGLAGLRAASAHAAAARVPLVAIGGLTLERASEIAPLASAGAVIAALLPFAHEREGAALSEVTVLARQLHSALSAPCPDSVFA